MPKKIFFINSHPIQYFAPLYQEIAKNKNFELTVLYGTVATTKGTIDKQFGVKVKWDIPLLEGYYYKVFKNYSFNKKFSSGFWQLINPGLILYLLQQPKSVVIIHGWGYCTHILAIIFSKIKGHTVCIRAETPLNQELRKNKLITFLKHLWLRFLFLFIDNFLYIGSENKKFYQHLGIKEHQLIFTPYAVDNSRFQQFSNQLSKNDAKQYLQLPVQDKIILYSGKYIYKKRPIDLLQAFNNIAANNNVHLVMVGDGELKPQMQAFITNNNLQTKVTLTGFINQSLIPYYYKAADVFVMCSGVGETWGLSTNEAMNFGIPVIISSTCGAAHNLIQGNGWIFDEGNIAALTNCLQEFINKPNKELEEMGQKSLHLVNAYSYNAIIDGLAKI